MRSTLFPLVALSFLFACGDGHDQDGTSQNDSTAVADSFVVWQTEQFADVRILRYRIPGWEQLSLQQKKELAYYLTMAGMAGRDIFWDQNHRYNLKVRRALESVLKSDKVDTSGADWQNFLVYAKKVFFSNGTHHFDSYAKYVPDCPRAYFEQVLAKSGTSLSKEVIDYMYDPLMDAKKVSKDPKKDLVLASAVNFYDEDVNQQEVEALYKAMETPDDTMAPSWGINSKVVRGGDGKLVERTWKIGGMYGPALAESIKWLEKAMTVAESEQQKKAIGLLIEYYRTGDVRTWDTFNVAWVKDTTSTVDFILGFVEVYDDPLGRKGSYEAIIEVTDPEATRNMKVIQDNAQWFEDKSPILPSHKKEKVTGITYRFINVCGESGSSAPKTPIGVNLPNANWIRKIGSKSVSLGNISEAYDKTSGKGALEVFCHDEEEIERAMAHGSLAAKLHTALHEVIGHASGRLEEGVGETDQTLKNYASTLEEGRADLVALYYALDPKLVEMGVMPSLEVGKAEYDGYIRNGLMVQLRRLKKGEDIEEDHMRNRQMVAAWVLEHGRKDSVIVEVERDGKRYYDIRDYEKLRGLFGELLREIQRIKSQGDYQAGHDLVENYGVKVDPALHDQVLARAASIKTAPYAGFIQPRLVPVTDAAGKITDIKVEYPEDFLQQMLEYAEKFSFLPDEN